MRVTYRFTKETRNYRRYDPEHTPAGMILGPIYMPKSDTADAFVVETTPVPF